MLKFQNSNLIENRDRKIHKNLIYLNKKRTEEKGNLSQLRLVLYAVCMNEFVCKTESNIKRNERLF